MKPRTKFNKIKVTVERWERLSSKYLKEEFSLNFKFLTYYSIKIRFSLIFLEFKFCQFFYLGHFQSNQIIEQLISSKLIVKLLKCPSLNS